MSLFENPEYQWRETFLVFFDVVNRPETKAVIEALNSMGTMEIAQSRSNSDHEFESATILAPDDFSAMDISCQSGDEVLEQIPELIEELKPNVASADEEEKLQKIMESTARFDILHFEQHSFEFSEDDAQPDFMDPGGLFVVLERLAELCNGIIVDPQTATVM